MIILARPRPKASLHSAGVKPRSPRRPLAVALAALRARQWLHFCALPLAGVAGGGLLAGPHECMRIALGLMVAGGCLGCAYGINAVAERRSDRSAAKNPLVAAPELAALATACALLVAALAVLSARALGPWSTLACGLSLLCGVSYSVAGKRVPGLGLLLNTGIFAPLMTVLLLPGQIPASCAHELAVFTALLIQNQLIHELADESEDRAAGARTTAQWLGGRDTLRAAVAAGAVIPPLSLVLAASWAQALLASALALATTALASAATQNPARARAAHRAAACAGGALLWLLARLGG